MPLNFLFHSYSLIYIPRLINKALKVLYTIIVLCALHAFFLNRQWPNENLLFLLTLFYRSGYRPRELKQLSKVTQEGGTQLVFNPYILASIASESFWLYLFLGQLDVVPRLYYANDSPAFL